MSSTFERGGEGSALLQRGRRESFSVSDLCPKELLNRTLTRLSGATSVQSSADA